MNVTRRTFSLRLGAGIVPVLTGTASLAQAYPERPIRMVVPFAAGGGIDFLARQINTKLGQNLGQPVVIENRPGASTAIGAELVAKAAPDGYTLLLSDHGTFAINPALFPKLAYRPQRDFAPISMVATAGMVLVVNPRELPVSTLAELIAAAKAAPAGLNFASPGPGTPHRLAMELLAQRTGGRFVPVSYNGSAPAMPDLLAGRVPLAFLSVPAAVTQIKAGRLRAIAVPTRSRLQGLPDVPTIAESGVSGYDATIWEAVMAPAGTPSGVVARINAALAAVVAEPEVRAKLIEGGFEPAGTTPEALAALMRSDSEKWAAIIREKRITAE